MACLSVWDIHGLSEGYSTDQIWKTGIFLVECHYNIPSKTLCAQSKRKVTLTPCISQLCKILYFESSAGFVCLDEWIFRRRCFLCLNEDQPRRRRLDIRLQTCPYFLYPEQLLKSVVMSDRRVKSSAVFNRSELSQGQHD